MNRKILTRMNEPHRVYHTMDHINTMMGEMLKHTKIVHNKKAVCQAILYHDVVYEVSSEKYPLNEAKSCEFMRKLCTDEVEFTEKLIMATKDHNPNVPGLTEHELSDMKLFLDVDMMIIGTKRISHLEWYEDAIRREFSIYTDEQYNNGRIAVLSKMLNDEVIFHSDAYAHLNDQAHRNLTYLIKKLKEKL